MRSVLPRWITATIPFRYPETFMDRHKYLAGRASELDLIHEKLRPAQLGDKCCDTLHAFYISGLGGMGKTELAYQYAVKYHNCYDVILIVKSDNKLRLLDAYKDIAKKLGLFSETESPSDDECRGALKTWFKRPHKMPSSEISLEETSRTSEDNLVKWLLIIDNAEQWSVLDLYWPDKGRGSVIVTSRKPNLLLELENSADIEYLELGSLPLEEGEKLLKYHAGYAGDDSVVVQKAAQDLATRLNGLPLALKQVGSYIKNCRMSIPKFCERRPKESDLYTVYLDHDQVRDYEHNLASVWTLESLSDDDESSRQAFILLCVLALLDPEGIQETLFELEQQESQVLGFSLSGTEFDDLCKPLINTSLVERTTKEDLTIHRMVQKVVRAKVIKDPTLLQNVIRFTLSRLMSRWPYHYRVYKIGTSGEKSRWDQCSLLVPHIASFSHAYAEFSEKRCISAPLVDLTELQYEAAL